MICFVIQSTLLRRVGTVSKTSMRGIVMVIDPTSQTGSSRFRVARFLGVGLVAGFLGGVVARAWMRVVAKNPEFTWSGSLAITIGFMVFGVTQSGALAARQIATKPSTSVSLGSPERSGCCHFSSRPGLKCFLRFLVEDLRWHVVSGLAGLESSQ
jgi:hypothetical protein